MKDLVTIGGSFGGGGGGGSARTPVTASDSLRSVSIVEFVDGISEGELEGFATVDPLQSAYLNDTPVKTGNTLNFQGVTLDYRLGTQNQTYIPGQEMSSAENASAAIEHIVNSDVTLATPVTKTISSNIADAIRVTVQLASLWSRNLSTGDVNGSQVALQIEVKPFGGAFMIVDLAGRGTITGKASSPYERSYHIELSQFGAAPYDIKVSRLTAEVTDGTVSNAIKWKAYTELMYAKLRYPNTAHAKLTFDARHFNQVPRRGYLMKGLKIKVPSPAFYDPVARTYSGLDWDGTFVTAWTRCPAWIFYDIITDPRYGLGKEVPESYVDKWNLWTIAQRCDQLIDDGFGGKESRYSMDLFLQQDGDAKKVVQDMASNFDAMGFWYGGGIYTAQDSPKTASALYTPANVIDGRFNYAGSARQVRYTVALVQWNDPDDFYKISTEYVEDTDGIARYGYREKKIVAVGCTSRGQAHRVGKRILLTSRLETDTVGFSVGLSGLVNKPGDIIRISDPLKHDGLRLSGRVGSGATTTNIPLDAEVTLDAGQSYTLCLIMPDGSLITTPVVSVAGVTQSIETFPALAAVPDSDAVWSLYSGSVPSMEYRILWINENSTDGKGGFYEINAVRYDPTKYTEIESISNLEPIYKKPYDNTNIVIQPTNVQVTDGVYMAVEGVVRYIDVSWSASTDGLLSTHIVSWSVDGGEKTEREITGASYRIENVKKGTYKIEVYAVNMAGAVSRSVSYDYVVGELYLINAVSVTALAIKGPGGNTFEGRSAEFSWSTDADTVLNLSDSYGTGNGGQSPWFRDFEVKIYQGTNLLRIEYTTKPYYIYTFENNVQDGGPFRSISITVAARDVYGQLSQSATLAVSNPAPTTFSNISIIAGVGQIYVKYFPPTDPDYQYTRVFASQAAGFIPDANSVTGNLVVEGSDRLLSFPVSPGTWYIRLQGVDEFGVAGATYSSQFSATAIGAETDKFAFTGLAFTPNSPTVNNVSWAAGTVSINGASPVAIASGSATWSAGTLYLYFDKITTSIGSTTDITIAVQKAQIIATYEGGENIKGGDGTGFFNGSQLIAQSVGANQLVANTAVITNTLQVASGIITDAHITDLSASKISATDLSVLSQNAGTITAGVLQSADGLFVIDLNNKFITIS